MITTLQQILENALERLALIVTTYLPSLLAGLTIFCVAYLIARLVRWALARMIKAAALDRFLAQSGLSSMFGRSERLRAARLISGTAYWSILLIGLLTGLSAFNTSLTSRMIEGAVFLFPKLVAAGAILLAGAWLGQFLARSTLVWAVNEDIPYARTLAAAVRIVIVFVSVVVAADHLEFARSVFLAAFIILVGGVVLAASIAAGIAAHSAIERRLEAPQRTGRESEKSLWNHL
jgi:hypothetical protein